jgi:polysaccharide deacetylase family protein (PEP-CTERM system associated)
MLNALTIDLEEYFHVSAYADSVAPQDWISYPSRVGESVGRILEMLDHHGCQATFFSLGWIAEHRPQVVRRIAESGHEIACHSNCHRCVFDMTPQEFRDDTRRAKQLLEDVSGKPVRGYRAPSFSITRRSQWALEILAELGFTYDSSIFPVQHMNYGIPDSPRFPFRFRTSSGPLVEFPMATIEFAGARAPFGGGAYFRLLPYRYTGWAIRHVNDIEKQAVCVYLHPWEIDADQPRMSGSLTARARHYCGLRGTEAKLNQLLTDLEFCTLGSLIDTLDLREVELPAA